MTIQTSDFFYVLLTARTYGDMDLGSKSNMKGLKSLGSNSWPPVDKTRSFTTTPPRHHFPIFHTVKCLIKGLQTFHHAPPLHLHQASAMTVNKQISFKKISQIVFKLQSDKKKKEEKQKSLKYFRCSKGCNSKSKLYRQKYMKEKKGSYQFLLKLLIAYE